MANIADVFLWDMLYNGKKRVIFTEVLCEI